MHRLRTDAWFVLLLCAASVAIHASLAQFIFDDAYIHFRIAKNLYVLGRPYFNPEEVVLGTSAPFWTCLLALLAPLGNLMPMACLVLNGVLSVLAAYLCALLVSDIADTNSSAARWITTLTAFAVLLRSSVGGMETPLAILLLAGGLKLVFEGRKGGYALLALGAFVRLELLCFLVLCLAWGFLRDKRIGISALGVASIVLGVGAAILCLFFSTIVPHPIIAKQAVYALNATQFVHIVLEHLLGPSLKASSGLASAWVVLLCALCAIAVFTFKLSNKSVGAKLLVVCGAGCVVLGAYAFKMVLIAPWYVPLFILPIILAIMAAHFQAPRSLTLAIVLILAGPFFISAFLTVMAAGGRQELYPDYSSSLRVQAYLDMGKKINAGYPGAVLLSPEIGALGYAFSGKVVDGVGLVSPLALQFHPLKVPEERSSGLLGALPPSLIQSVRPNIVVCLEMLCEAVLKSNALEGYGHQVQSLAENDGGNRKNDFWSMQNLHVWTRR